MIIRKRRCYASFLPGVLLLFSAFCCFADAQDAIVHTGESSISQKTIPSTVLQEERPLRIYLPRGYGLSETRYPVLVILDTEQEDHFQRSVQVAESLADHDKLPRMIIVGIDNTDRFRDMNVPEFEYRDLSYDGRADEFLQFIDKEFFAFIDQEFRTTPFRILFGRSASATFSIYAMVTRPALFRAYIASSPSFFVNYEIIVANTRKFFAENESPDRVFFLNLGTEDSEKRVTQTKEYAGLVGQLAPPEFRWQLEVMHGIGHVPETSMEDGLKMIFKAAVIH